MTETGGTFQPDWTIEEVAERIDAIGNREDLQVFPPFPSGFYDHLENSLRVALGE